MQKLHLVGFTKDHEGLILSARRGARSGGYLLTIDGALEEAVDELRARRAEEAADDGAQVEAPRRPRVESALSVREIQARLRQGRSVPEVARAAGVDAEWVERFAPPVLAERAQVIAKVLSVPLRRARLGPSALPIGEAVRHHLADRGVAMTADEFGDAWSARQVAEGRWAVRCSFRHRGRDQTLRFDLDEGTGEVTSADRQSGQLGYVTPPTRPAAKAERPRAPTDDGERPAVKRAVVSTGFRPDPVVKPVSRSAKERERAAAAMRKAAAQRAIEGERAAARKLKERRDEEARRRKAEEVAAARAERAARAADAAARRAAAEKAKADKARAAERAAARRQAAAERAAAATKAAGAKKAAKTTTTATTTTAAKKATVATRAATKKAATAKAATKKAVTKKAATKKAATKKATATATVATKKAATATVATKKAAPAAPAATPRRSGATTRTTTAKRSSASATTRTAAARSVPGAAPRERVAAASAPATPTAPPRPGPAATPAAAGRSAPPRPTPAARPGADPAPPPRTPAAADRPEPAVRPVPRPTGPQRWTPPIPALHPTPARSSDRGLDPSPDIRVFRPEPRREAHDDAGRITGAAADVYGTESTRALFRRGLVEQASGDVPPARPPAPPANGDRPAPSAAAAPAPRPRRTRPLRAT